MSDGIVKTQIKPLSYRLVEETVSNGTVWSPLPCPPLPSNPQELTLSDTEHPSLPTVHVFTVTVTTPTTTRVITISQSLYCDPHPHTPSSFLSRSLLSPSLGPSTFYRFFPSPSPPPLFPLLPFPLSIGSSPLLPSLPHWPFSPLPFPPSSSGFLFLFCPPSPSLTQWETLVIVVVVVIVGVLLLHCVYDQLREKVKARMRHRSSVRFTRSTHSEVWQPQT